MQKNILLTGASSGIGKAIAELLAQNEYKVFATVRKEDDKISIEKLHSNIHCFLVDVTSESDLQCLKSDIIAEADELFAIINNAGVAYTGIMECANIDELKEQFDINTFAPLRIVKEFLPMMNEGKIINMSSISSSVVYPFISPYCASKRSLDIFFQALDIEIDNPKIKIVSIKPATIKTPIWEKSHKAARERFEKLPLNIQEKYKPILEKLLARSEKSAENGLEVSKVTSLVLKILNTDNPKKSYPVGTTSHIAAIFGKLPVEWQVKIAKKAMHFYR